MNDWLGKKKTKLKCYLKRVIKPVTVCNNCLFFNKIMSKTKLTITTNASNIPHFDLITSLGIKIIDRIISITKKVKIVKP